ncbi:PREDICTED: probable basic-leucine zipper transcription factor J [Papilio polytes]|uniref:probable basic-leucine zipper transcription factor J n=1 Tax=Papilio polytes TaxID=76194 RepID=UPI0006761DB7|nr:PREDICTED: probable basic-leucine zipper transcription factor J [Papilio polytes]
MIVFQFYVFMLLVSLFQCRLPDKVLCVNEKCSEPISKAKTLLTYNSGDPDLMSFRANSDALVYMKSAGSNPDLWYAKINGKTGFVSSRFLRESKIIERNPTYLVPIEKNVKEDLQPDKVQQPHEVFEGTTIFTTEATSNQEESITEQPVHATPENILPLSAVETQSIDSENNNDNNNDSIPAENDSTVSDSVNTETVTVVDNNPDLQTDQENSASNNDNKIIENIDPNVQLNSNSVENMLLNSDTQGSTAEGVDVSNEITTETIDTVNIETEENPESANISTEIPEIVPSSQEPEAPSTSSPSNNANIEQAEQNYDNFSSETLNTVTENFPSQEHERESNENILTDANTEIPVEDIPQTLPSKDIPEHIEQNIPSANTENIEINSPETKEDNLPLDSHIESTEKPPETEIPSNIDNFNNVPQQDILNNQQYAQPSIPSNLGTIPAATIEAIHTSDTAEVDYTTPPNIPTTVETTEQTNIPTDEVISTSSSENSDSTTESNTPPTESAPPITIEDLYSMSTESPELNNDNAESIISDMYSTVASLWPTTTETPPHYESLFNPENPQPETEKEFSIMKYIITTYNNVMGINEQTKAIFATAGETCYTDEYCDGESFSQKHRLLTFLLTTAGAVLLFTLGFYYIENKRQDGKLIGTINSLQRDLLFSTKECEILKEELATTKNKLTGIEDNSFGMDDMVKSLKEEINELKAQNDRLRNSLDDNEKLLRVSENTAGELQNTLGEVENTLSELLAERDHAEEQITELNGKIQAFEEELISVSRERDNFQLKFVSAETSLEEYKKQKKQFEEMNKKLSDANNTIELQNHEIEALKDAIKELKSGTSSDVDAATLIDHTEIKAKLSKALEERQSYLSKYEIEHNERVRLAEELKTTQESYSTSSQQASEALTRLEVLGKYFQERESELMKELSAKESLWLSKQGESASTVEKIELLQQELQRFKERCDALTLELAEAESKFGIRMFFGIG